MAALALDGNLMRAQRGLVAICTIQVGTWGQSEEPSHLSRAMMQCLPGLLVQGSLLTGGRARWLQDSMCHSTCSLEPCGPRGCERGPWLCPWSPSQASATATKASSACTDPWNMVQPNGRMWSAAKGAQKLQRRVPEPGRVATPGRYGGADAKHAGGNILRNRHASTRTQHRSGQPRADRAWHCAELRVSPAGGDPRPTSAGEDPGPATAAVPRPLGLGCQLRNVVVPAWRRCQSSAVARRRC
eukprot:jgi/Mesen1/2499/ME000159S01611